MDGQLVRSLADVLCNVFGLVRIAPSIHYANVRWWLQDNSQCDVTDGEMISMLYLVDQFPSAAVRLKDVWHHFISRVFEPSSCAVSSAISVTSPMALGPRSVSPGIGGRTLGPAGERWQVARNFLDSEPGVCRLVLLCLLRRAM